MDNIENALPRALSNQIDSASSKIAPLWPLSHFVAVNPFLGFADHDFALTAEAHKRVQGSDLVMPITWFKEKFESGDVRLENLRAAVAVATPEVVESFESADQALTAENIVALLSESEQGADPLYQTCSFSAYLDSREGTQWQHVIREVKPT